MKAIIELSRKGSIFKAAAQQVAGARRGQAPDFRLSFESARALFAELTPARLDLLDTLHSSDREHNAPAQRYTTAHVAVARATRGDRHADFARVREDLGDILRALCPHHHFRWMICKPLVACVRSERLRIVADKSGSKNPA